MIKCAQAIGTLFIMLKIRSDNRKILLFFTLNKGIFHFLYLYLLSAEALQIKKLLN